MKKLSDRLIIQDDKIVHQKKFDAQDTLDAVRRRKDAGNPAFGQAQHVARIPGELIDAECRRLGVAPHDNRARWEVIRRMVTSGDYSRLVTTDKRPW